MRHEFSKSVTQVFAQKAHHRMLTGDLGHGVLDSIRSETPQQFLNMGVSEPHMLAFACGLAIHGHPTWIYSMPSFVVLRCAEALRNLVIEPQLPIHIVASGAAYSYGRMGSSHHSIEDLGVLKSLGKIQIYLPAQPQDVHHCVTRMATQKGPSYLRLIHQQRPLQLPEFKTLRLLPSPSKEKTLIVSVGGALRFLADWQKYSVAVLGTYPLDLESLRELSSYIADCDVQNIITIEEHLVQGGVGESLRHQVPSGRATWRHFGLERSHDLNLGEGDAMCERLGLSAELINAWIETPS